LFHLLLTFYPYGQLFSRVGFYYIAGGLSIKNIVVERLEITR
jgi:hypothetical protein